MEKIVIVEDELIVARDLRKTLERNGYTDTIITEINMPENNKKCVACVYIISTIKIF